MKSTKRGAAALCGMFFWGAAAYADQLTDNINEAVALNVGDTMTGQFVANSTLINLDKVIGATLALTLADDGEATTPTTGESNTNINTYTNTINGVRTVTTTYTSTAYFLDEEMDSVQILFGNQTQDATIEGGTVSYLGEQTIDGPTPVPAENCNNTFGFFTSCATMTIRNVNYSLSGNTGENVVYVQLDDAALQTFKQTGTLDYIVTGTAGDLSVKNATLDVAIQTVNVTFDDYEPQSLDDMFAVNAVNNAGVVVGQTRTNTTDGWPHAAMWESGTLTDLGMHGCRDTVSHCWSHAYGINDQGQIVGESFTDLSWPSQYFGPWSIYYAHEVMWQNAGTPLEFMRTLGWEYGKTLDINAQGHAVGHGRSVDWNIALGDYFVHGFLWLSNNERVEFGEYGQASKAFALNDIDQVVGEITTNGATQAFFWDNGVMTTLGHLGGGRSTAVDINNEGQVVGSATNASGQWRAFMWEGGFLYELETLSDTIASHAYAINESGLIVGEMDGRAVVWKGGRLVDLNDYVDASYGLELTKAVAVNNKGQIVARTAAANSFHLLSIIEVPPPSDVSVCPSGCDYSSIQDGIEAAGSGHTVLVHPGTYNEMVRVYKGITLISWKGPGETIIDATGLDGSTVTLSGGTIDGFTVRGGSAQYGGGIRIGSGTVQNNIITDNSASLDGGGLYVGGRGSIAVIQNNIISNNESARYGGGISHSSYTDVTMLNNTFTGNNATYGGGAFMGPYSTLKFVNNVLKANNASYGGGVFMSSYSRGQVVNSLIAENTATHGGGVGFGSYTGGQVINSTIVNNSDGIGVFSYSNPTIRNTIIWGNTNYQILRGTVTNSIIQGGYAGDGNLDADPMFVNAAAGDYHLMADSPAVDTGSDASAVDGATADFDGVVRPQDGDGLGAGTTGDGSDYDIGAFEFQ